MDPIALLALLWLAGGKKSGQGDDVQALPADAPRSAETPPRNTAAPSQQSPKSTAKTPTDEALIRRATQKKAQGWIEDFLALGVSPDEAASYGRWAGIESSGNPLAVSPLGERGLFQLMPSTAKDATTPADWAARIRPTTTRAEHARIALAQARWHWERAKRYITNPPSDALSKIWYAKRHHSRPADFNGRVMHGGAVAMAREQEASYQGKPNALARLHAANIIAFGVPVPRVPSA